MAATYNGVAVRLQTDHRPTRNAPLRYAAMCTDPYPEREVAPPGHVPIPWHVLHDSLIDALRDADGLPLHIVGLDDLDDEQQQRRAEHDAAVAELTAARTELDTIEHQLLETDDTGRRLVTGALLSKLDASYNELTERFIPELEHRVAETQAALDRASTPDPNLADHRQLLHLAERLGDPHDTSLRPLWLESLRELTITTTRLHHATARGWQVDWSATLRFHDGEHSYDIPVTGRWHTGAAAGLPRRLDDLVGEHLDRLCAGEPLPYQTATRWTQVQPRLIRRLVGDGPAPLVLGCTDPTITAAATRLHLEPDRADHAVAADLDVSTAFIARVRAVHLDGPPRRSWHHQPAPAAQALYELAVANGGHVTAANVTELAGTSTAQVWNVMSKLRKTTDLWTSERKKGYRLRACRCGALNWTLMRIPEPHTAICRTCRRDLADLHWPADPYHPYETLLDPRRGNGA